MERPYEQIRRMVKLFEYNRLKLRFRNEDERARFIDGEQFLHIWYFFYFFFQIFI